MLYRTIALFGLAAIGWAIACGSDSLPSETPVPTEERSEPTAMPPEPTATVVGFSYIATNHWGKATASIEERTYQSDVVVKARLVSAANSVLTFRSITYIKGTGPADFTVQAETDGRNTQWDNQDAILFLKSAPNIKPTFRFTDTTSWDYWEDFQGPVAYTGNLPEGYTVDSRNPVWLPIEGSGSSSDHTRSAGQSSGSGGPVVTEYSGGRPKTVTQDAVLDAIRWTNAATSAQSGGNSLNGGNSRFNTYSRSASDVVTSNVYPASDVQRCLIGTLAWFRNVRDWEAYNGKSKNYISDYRFEIESGAARGTLVDEYDQHSDRLDGAQSYTNYWTEGRDAGLFETILTDDDNDARTGYDLRVVIKRPLPAGEYFFKHYGQPYLERACDATTEYSYANTYVTVTAPPGAAHEAFFDPATTTSGVGYTAGSATTTGVLQPATFSQRGRDITITGLEWRNGQVVMSFDRTVQLSERFSFIRLDGTVGLYLSRFDATEDLRARTVTWQVPERPWEPGDELMLRIGPIPLPGVRNLTAERGSDREVVLSWEVPYRAGVSGYRIWRHQPGRDEGPKVYVADTRSTDTTFTDEYSPLPNLTEYSVQAIDRSYNAGESSESVRVGGP